MGGYSEIFLERLRIYRLCKEQKIAVLVEAEQERRRVWNKKLERREERQWIHQARVKLRETKQLLKRGCQESLS